MNSDFLEYIKETQVHTLVVDGNETIDAFSFTIYTHHCYNDKLLDGFDPEYPWVEYKWDVVR